MDLGQISTKITSLCNSDTNEYTNALRLIDINNAQDEIEAMIFRAQDGWKFDDTNQSGVPVLLTNTTAGTATYNLTSPDIRIIKLEYSDDGVSWIDAQNIDQRGMPDVLPTSVYTMVNPAYSIMGKQITVYPTPANSTTSGIKITVNRLAVVFTVANLTATVASDLVSPGFNRAFHTMIAYYCAIEWSLAKGLSNLAGLQQKWAEKTAQLKDFYSNKLNDAKVSLRAKWNNFR